MTRIAIWPRHFRPRCGLRARNRRAHADLDYMLYEGHPTSRRCSPYQHVYGCLIEAGPDSFITENHSATDLCRCRPSDQLIGSDHAYCKTYILTNARLVVMPDGLMFMVPTKFFLLACRRFFPGRPKLHMMRELLHAPRPITTQFVSTFKLQRHYGSEKRPTRRSIAVWRLRRRSRLTSAFALFSHGLRKWSARTESQAAPCSRRGKRIRQDRASHRRFSLRQERHVQWPRPSPRATPTSIVTGALVQNAQPQAEDGLYQPARETYYFDELLLRCLGPRRLKCFTPRVQSFPLNSPRFSTVLRSLRVSVTIAVSVSHSLQASDFLYRAAKRASAPASRHFRSQQIPAFFPAKKQRSRARSSGARCGNLL